MPSLPSNFSGFDFRNTSNIGGYGFPTSGTYNVEESGYKPFGALGQGDDSNLGVDLDVSPLDRFMLVTIFVPTDALQTLPITATLTLELGSYEWANINFTTPKQP